MNPKKLKKLKKQVQKHPASRAEPYITRMQRYRNRFAQIPEIQVLVNNVLLADELLTKGRLPQDLPVLELPDNIQDILFQNINARFAPHDPKGDQLWNELSDALPKLDQDLRNFRDYLEDRYGMWAYISAPFAADLAQYIDGKKTLEVMAGNGYISKGLRDHDQLVYATDSKDWTKENETGKHPVTEIERLSALDAWQKYGNEVDVVIMSWSPDGLPVDWELLQAIRRSEHHVDFIVIGEMNGATDSKVFWDNLQLTGTDESLELLNRHHKVFDLIQDHTFLVR
ncbi:SAM-dependent methyltransferase [Levilactobacillus bambusae]|uniref:SAM-dependent methyltransferase n=1 Tax=Levilactobacillus bambusae TaxID=2024736 RepID=A0A2V1MXW3_9LACO|nr:SAM-dependent methyltransferase [Levilactobacillus bambusae]PWF99836.1 SAM-dependent methyltransferase [Levilactobacillus bambusae]